MLAHTSPPQAHLGQGRPPRADVRPHRAQDAGSRRLKLPPSRVPAGPEEIAPAPAKAVRLRSSRPILQRLGANPGCTAAEASDIHQAIFDARGWLLKAIPQLEASPLSGAALASLRRNFGPTFGEAVNAGLIVGRLKVAYHELSTIPFSCAGAANATCAGGAGGFSFPGTHASAVCTNVWATTADAVYRAATALHESLHAAFPRFTIDHYSGWHGHAGGTAPYPGPGTDPLLNADSYTSLVIDLS